MTRAFLVLVLLLAPFSIARAEPEGGLTLGAIGAFFQRLFHGPAPAAPKPAPHYVLGAPYQADGAWYYPRERFGYDQSGIAGVYAPGHPPLTADGEAFDRNAMAAAHQTLQLPAIAAVTDLENGRKVLLRINDRGPASPKRLIEVTPRVAQLLGFATDGTARVRVELDSAMSQALAQQLQGGIGGLTIAAAPVGTVEASALPPPAGVAASTHAWQAPKTADASRVGAENAKTQSVPLRLPETVTQAAAGPGSLWIECDSFASYAYARREAARLASLGAKIVRRGSGSGESNVVRIGPIDSVRSADALLDRVLHAGVTGARIVVEQE